MRVYFSGISGTAIGPLAELANDAGFDVLGSDLKPGAISGEIKKREIPVFYGDQNGDFLRNNHQKKPIDWFVYTSALPKNHPELLLAKKLGIKCSKRDEFIASFINLHHFKMVAVAGTHGKTTTTSMIIWALRQLNIPISYLVGTTLGWAPGGIFNKDSEFFIYEADEYDHNFLAYHPFLSAITCIDYDHPDIYPTKADYNAAFAQFEAQSQNVIKDTAIRPEINLIGELRRQDASIALRSIQQILPDINERNIIEALNSFPGSGRRFEEIATNVFSDYGHHPSEIRETLKMAQEYRKARKLAGVAVIYQPHQNVRQHEIKDEYKDAFIDADKIFWLPTYLTRENPNLKILTPQDLISILSNQDKAEVAELDDNLLAKAKELLARGWLLILLSAGPADSWLRDNF